MKYCREDGNSETGQSLEKQRKKGEVGKVMRRKSGWWRMQVGREADTHKDEGENQHSQETVREVGEERSESRRSRSVECEGAVLGRYRPTGHLRGYFVERLESCRGEEAVKEWSKEGRRKEERREQGQQRLLAVAQEVESRRTV
jgi:hypothetical protein